MNKKIWNNGDSPQSVVASRFAENELEDLKAVERKDISDYSVNQLKRNLIDIKSYGLWSQDIPEVKDLAIGDTFEVPHFTFTPYRRSRGDYNVCNAVFKVLDKKTISKVTEVLNADGTKFGKRKTKTSYVLLECDQDRDQGPDNWFEICSDFSARRDGGGYYFPLKKKKQQWVSQKQILMMFLKDGGLCPLKRRGQDCRYCN